jgi:hypothetical protein
MDPLTLSKRTGIWPSLCQDLHDRYRIIYAANLLEYDYDMSRLWQELLPYRDINFSENDRMIFTLYDTEYYVDDMKLGFTSENLIRILQDLNISFGYCLLFTNHHGINVAWSKKCGRFSVKVYENNFSYICTPSTPKILERNAYQIKKTFCFMSNVRRDHRSYVRIWIEDQNIKNRAIISWNSDWKRLNHYQPKEESSNTCTCEFIYPKPFTRIKDKISVSDHLIKLFNQNTAILDIDYRDSSITSGPNENNFEAPWLAETFLNIVTETVFHYPYPYLSEKTFKCFWHRSPFIIVGAANSLKYLKSIGFKTFDQWFNESYDDIIDPIKRLDNILQTLNLISKWSLSQCQDVYNSMETVLSYNLQHYQTHFCQKMLAETKQNI